MSCAFDCDHKLALVPGTRSGNPLWDDFALFVHAPLQSLLVLVIDVDILAIAKPARPFLPLLLVLPLRARGAVGINRKSWFSYHSSISIDSKVVHDFSADAAFGTSTKSLALGQKLRGPVFFRHLPLALLQLRVPLRGVLPGFLESPLSRDRSV